MEKIKVSVSCPKNKALSHLKTVCTHKYYVAKYCFKMGLYWQGLTHDLSKFTPIEFLESVKYYQGTRSPIDACKEANGWSQAWMHHKGANKHHYEYWVDDFDHGGHPLRMPFKYAAEMVADYLGAGNAYREKNFTYQDEYEWWKAKSSKPLAMHPETKLFIEKVLFELSQSNDPDTVLDIKHLEKLYNESITGKYGIKA